MAKRKLNTEDFRIITPIMCSVMLFLLGIVGVVVSKAYNDIQTANVTLGRIDEKLSSIEEKNRDQDKAIDILRDKLPKTLVYEINPKKK